MISIPEAPVEKSPLIGLTPECRPETRLHEQAVVDVGDQLRLVARARQQLQREAPDAGRAGEPARSALPVETVPARRAE